MYNNKLYILITILLISCSNDIRYRVVGVIYKVHHHNNELTIHHDEIPDFMSAMTMNFKVDNSVDLNQFKIGDSVHFSLFIK